MTDTTVPSEPADELPQGEVAPPSEPQPVDGSGSPIPTPDRSSSPGHAAPTDPETISAPTADGPGVDTSPADVVPTGADQGVPAETLTAVDEAQPEPVERWLGDVNVHAPQAEFLDRRVICPACSQQFTLRELTVAEELTDTGGVAALQTPHITVDGQTFVPGDDTDLESVEHVNRNDSATLALHPVS